MNKVLFLLFFPVLISVAGLGQQAIVLPDSPSHTIVSQYALLPDNGYSFGQVLTDTSLHFVENDSVRLQKATVYWLRLQLKQPSHYAGEYRCWLRTPMHNTLYYFNADSNAWVHNEAGVAPGANGQMVQDGLPCLLQGNNHLNTVYIKMDLQAAHSAAVAFAPQVIIKKQAAVDYMDNFLFISWVCSIVMLFLFFLNHLYLYYSLKDRTVWYYLITLVGGMIYITLHKRVLLQWLRKPWFTWKITPDGVLHQYNLGDILMHSSVAIVLYGLIQFNRSYLNTRRWLPGWDAFLKYGLYGYIGGTIVLILINSCWFYWNADTLLYENVAVMLLALAMVCTNITGYLRKLTASGPLLVASTLPVACIMAISLYHIFWGFYDTQTSILPDLGVITEVFVFSSALVYRIRLVKKDLKARQMEAQQLAFDIKEIEMRHRLVTLENEQIKDSMLHEKTRNGQLQEKLEANQRELASISLHMVQKNEMLAALRQEIKGLGERYPEKEQDKLRGISSILKSNLHLDSEWEKFKVHFEQVHPRFFEELQAKYPTLTKNETRLYAYFHINMSTKEIAALLNIDPASVRQAKARLQKKINQTQTENR